MIEHIQHFSRKNHFFEKAFLSAELLNVLNVVGPWSEISARLEGPHGPKNIQHIQHIEHFSRKKRFFWNLRSYIIQHFSRRTFFFEKAFLSAELLNMVNVVGPWSEISARLEGPHGPNNNQHTQHIQHFSRKKHFLEP